VLQTFKKNYAKWCWMFFLLCLIVQLVKLQQYIGAAILNSSRTNILMELPCCTNSIGAIHLAKKSKSVSLLNRQGAATNNMNDSND
jgi:hypothetical protein